ncbi:unnamed protein product [Protopolystoma xenopodis]|uniref:Uncharacterized protein n=1 Tax=Protopolystoma xenopodis TaxID=117903 RepID=A0A3S5CH39_9PLAT|nr:unnamed protein product [Protopolystoma xenopodis]
MQLCCGDKLPNGVDNVNLYTYSISQSTTHTHTHQRRPESRFQIESGNLHSTCPLSLQFQATICFIGPSRAGTCGPRDSTFTDRVRKCLELGDNNYVNTISSSRGWATNYCTSPQYAGRSYCLRLGQKESIGQRVGVLPTLKKKRRIRFSPVDSSLSAS